jgi:hypothetical protein
VRIRGPGAALSFTWVTGSRLAAFYDGDRLLVWDSSLPYGVGVTVGVGVKGGVARTKAEQHCVMEGIEGEVTASACAPDGSMIAIGTDDGIMTIMRLVDLQVASRIRVEDSAITCVKFASTGSDVVWVHASGRSVLWRFSNDRPTGVFSVPAVVSQAFMLDARVMLNGEVMLASSSGELWLLSTGALYVGNALAEVKVCTKGRRTLILADDDDGNAHVTGDGDGAGAGDDGQVPLDWETFASDIEVARAAADAASALEARDRAHVHDIVQSLVVEVARTHVMFEMEAAAAAIAVATAAASSLAAAAEAEAAAKRNALAATSLAAAEAAAAAAAVLTAAGEIFWPEKEWINGVMKGGLGKRGQSLKTVAARWQQLIKKGEGLKKEWRNVDSSGNGTVSQSEVLTWIATSHPDLNDPMVVQYAFQAALELQAHQHHAPMSSAFSPSSVHPSLQSSRRFTAPQSLSLTFDFFPPLLSNLVAASRAIVIFRLWDGGGAAGGDKRLQRREWEKGIKCLKRALLSHDEIVAEWKLVDADGKGAALFGEFCRWFRYCSCCYSLSLLLLAQPKTCFSQQDEGPARLVHIIGPVSPRCNCPFLILANRLIDV